MDNIIEKQIHLPQSFDLRLFWGLEEDHIHLLQEELKCRLIARGHVVKVLAPEEQMPYIEAVINDLIDSYKKNGRLTAEDIQTTIFINRLNEDDIQAPLSKEETAGVGVVALENGMVKPRSEGQKQLLQAIQKNDIVFAVGPAGTGKTYLATAMAVSFLNRGVIGKIVLARPAVEAGESLGFLPGDFKEKIDPYLKPLYDALEDMMPRDRLKRLLDTGVIEILPLAYMRGRTLNHAFIILDEAQNSTFMQMKMFLTRLGRHAKAVITGDITQIDLQDKKQSGLISSIRVLEGISGIAFVYMNKDDVVRHELVKEIIQAYDKFQKKDHMGE